MFRRIFLSGIILVGLLSTQTVPGALAATQCDSAQFVSDITAPDGAAFAPGAAFTKIWRFLNNGTCTWTTSYTIAFVGGDSLGAPPPLKLPAVVLPGQAIDLAVGLKAPLASGHYRGLWKFTNASGVQFGIGDTASDAFWVDINVIDTTAVIYDFVANAAYAQWKSGAGYLPYPGTSGDSRGYAFQVNPPHLENDSFDPSPGLLTVPQNNFGGYLQATYPEIQVQSGDKLQTLVNCEFGATGCYVTFRIDYLNSAGAQKTLWSWKEAYDGRFYRANIDLSFLAGQKVRFILMLLSSGFASGDRALWGSPRIVRTGTTQPPAPPPTLTPLPPLTPTATPFNQPPPTIAASSCDKAAFVADIAVPDGTLFSPGAAFTKTWRLKNSGSCNWTTAYKFMFYSGEQMGAPTSLNIPRIVPPGQTVDISVNMVAPSSAGKFRGNWILSNANGALFGIGVDASKPIWVEINVAGQSPVGAGYDFTANACSAEWRSGAGLLPCPGTEGSASGFVLKQAAPRLEDGSIGAPGLLIFPQNKFDGYIQGLYPAFTVQPGDRFKTSVGCESGAACYVTFRLDYMTAAGSIKTFWSWREKNEKHYYNASLDLTALAGQSVRFMLTLLATGSPTNDRALWGSPSIVRAGGVPVTTTPVTPTITPIPPVTNWLTYTNPTYAFQFKYPLGSQVSNEQNNFVRIDLPFVPNTNLREKYLEVSVTENANPCHSPLAPASFPAETVTINGIPFTKETLADAGVGHLHQVVAYSTLRGNVCVSLGFILHSLAPGNYATPPVVFDYASESAVFLQMVSTFMWQTQTPPTPVVSIATVQSVEIQIVEAQPLQVNAIVRGQLPDSGCTKVSSTNQVRDGNTLRLTLMTSTDPLTQCAPAPSPFEQVIALDVAGLPPARYTVNANGIEQGFELVTRDLTKFGQVLVDALNAQNFDTLKILMDQAFGFAFWQSQGTSYTPDLAIEQLRTNYLGATTHLTADTSKDLNTLLGGLNPYAIMGLDPAKSQALFVSGWGLDGNDEAILYSTRLSDGSLYWHSVLIAKGGFVNP